MSQRLDDRYELLDADCVSFWRGLLNAPSDTSHIPPPGACVFAVQIE
jgi:hypothetical protein